MRVVLTDALDAADRPGWDTLTRDSFYSSAGWLDLLAADPDVRPGYALAGSSPGQLRVALPFYQVWRETNGFYDWDTASVARGLRPPGRRLLLGPHRGYRTRLHAAAGADPAPVVEAVLQHAAREGLVGAVAMFADTATALALHACRPDAVVVHLADDATLHLPGATFADYLDGLGGHRRRRVRRERDRFAAAGYTVTAHALAEVAGVVGPLLGQVQRRYGQPADGAALARSLGAQGRAMGHEAQVRVLRRAGEPVGFVLFYCHGDTLYLRAAGFAYDRLVGAYEYFNLVYYLPIELCYERGLRQVHAGIEAARAKALRGAVVTPLWLVSLGSGPAERPGSGERSAAMAYNAHALAQVSAQIGDVAPVDIAHWQPFLAPSSLARSDA